MKRDGGRAGGGVRKTEIQEIVNRMKNGSIRRNVKYSEKAWCVKLEEQCNC